MRSTLARALVALTLVLVAAPVALADVDLCATASCSGRTTTGTIGAASTSLALGAAIDLANGQGIRVNHAGAAPTIGTPTGLGVAPVGVAGSTSYLYQIAAFDDRCGISAATSAGGISNGNAILDANNYNDVTFAAGAGATPRGYIVWRKVGSGAYQYYKLVNFTEWWDYGVGDAKPDWVPALPPVAPLSQCLQTTIAAGGGTTTLTLTDPATTATTAEVVTHDDSVALTNAVTALNAAGGGYNLTCPGSARIRYLTRPPIISVANANVVGSPGCTFLPVGDGIALNLTGPATGAALTLTAPVLEGSTRVSLASVAGLVVDRDYVAIEQLPPAGSGIGPTVAKNFFVSPIKFIQGNDVYLNDPSPTVFAPSFTTIAVSGTWFANDTITVSFPGASPSSVTYRVINGDTYASIAQNVAMAINNAFGGLPATDGTRVYAQSQRASSGSLTSQVLIFVPSTLTTTIGTSAVSAGGLLTLVANDAATAPNVRVWTPLDGGVGVYGLVIDGRDSSGGLIFAANYTDERFKNLTLKNAHFGAALKTQGANYFVLLDDVTGVDNGSAAVNFTQPSDIWVTYATVVQRSNVRSRGSKGFGPQDQTGSYLMGVNEYQSGASGGRGRKVEAYGGVLLANEMSHNVAYTNFALAYGLHSASISGVLAYGGDERSLLSNATCLWTDDSGVTLVRWFGVHTRRCYKDDLELPIPNVRNGAMGLVLGGGVSSIYNAGMGRFYYLNGYDRVGGNTGLTTFGGTVAAQQSPIIMMNYDQ